MRDFQYSFQKLKSYCEDEEYRGWDPYDGLNSKIFQVTPFKYWDLARLAWIQFFKRSPLNFRKILLVPKEYNSKGIALFLSSYCNLYELALKGEIDFGTTDDLLVKINELANLLDDLKNTNYSGACWGYNFDWQSRAFFLPANTPTIVATSFAVEALLKAYEITKNKAYYKTAISSSSFILHDLNRIQKDDNLFMFSYSPLDERAVYNATLLASKTLALIYHYTNDIKLKNIAFLSIKAVCNEQNIDGSFPHSDQVGQKWRDSFHTGFKLESIQYYQKYCDDNTFNLNLEKGFSYWRRNFFDKDTGFSFYFDRGMNSSLVDLHCVAQALSTFLKLEQYSKNRILIERITLWAIENMQNKKGYFNFQKKNNRINKIQYMRWPNAWMFYGLSYYFVIRKNND
jgi:hypothetical protein